MKTILCYGDSNTWGYVPGKFNLATMYMERYPRHIRWTGRLQKLLGEHYHVIEEGLNGRTTNLDSPIPPDRNGKTYLMPCLYTHAPLDLVILMLGANDLKNIFGRSAEDIANGLAELVRMIQLSQYGSDMQSPPKILLIGYPTLSTEEAGIIYGDKDLLKDGIVRSQQFDAYFLKVAERYGCYYFNAAPHVQLSLIDGLHLDEKGHKVLAEFLAREVKNIFK